MTERTRPQEQLFNIVENFSQALRNEDFVKKTRSFLLAYENGRVSVMVSRLVYDVRVCERKLFLKRPGESDVTIFLPLDFLQGWTRKERNTAVAVSVVEAVSILEGLSGQKFIGNCKLIDHLADSLI